MENYLIVNANILTFGDKPQNIRNGALCIGGGTILDFGKERDIINKNPMITKRIDAKGKVVMPGFIDLHNHLYSSFFQNIPVDTSKVSNYNEFLDKYWWKLTKKLSSDAVYYSAVKGIVNAIKAGTTTIFNMHSSNENYYDSLTDIAEAFEELSMRGVLGFEVTNRYGEEEAMKMIDANSEFIQNYSSNPLISGMLGLHNASDASDEMLKKINRITKKTGCGLMLHLSETENEDEISLEKYNKYTLDRLQDFNLLNTKTLVAAANYIDEYEVDVLTKTGASVALLPSSSYYKGFEFAPVDQYCSRKVKLGFGSDGIFSSMSKEALFTHKVLRQKLGTFNGGNKEIADIISSSTYKIANKFVSKSIGEIKLGCAADLIIVDYIPEYEISIENVHSHLMYGILPARVQSTIINGNFVMKDYELVGIDENDLNEKYIEFAKELS